MEATAESASRRRVIALIGFALAVSMLRLPILAVGDELDPSWMHALAAFMRDGKRAGIDYVFTFGPLGYFYTPAYEPGVFWPRMAWAGAFAAVFGLVMTRAALRMPGRIRPIAFLALPALLPMGTDAVVVLTLLVTTLGVLDEGQPSRLQRWLAGALFAVLAHVKLTFVALAGVAGLVMVVHVGATRGPRAAAGDIGVGLGAYFGLWLALGQSLGDWPTYVTRGSAIVSGYAQAMALPGPSSWLVLAALSGAVLAATLLLRCLRAGGSEWLRAALVGLFLLATWKMGFVRQDGHAANFFAVSGMLPFLLWPVEPTGSSRRARGLPVMLGACMATGILGLQLSLADSKPLSRWPHLASERYSQAPLRFLTPWALRERMDTKRAELAERFALPEILEVVGDGSVDMLGHSQGVLELNGLKWKNRPVFQSYSAYTPALAELNAGFFVGREAPDFVLLDGRTLDGRLPWMEDGDAVLEVLSRYEPRLFSRGYLLLGRRGEPVLVRGEVLLEKSVRAGDTVEIAPLGPEPKLLAVDLRPSLPGRLRNTLFRSPIPFLELELEGGETRRYRIVPGMLRGGIPFDPLLEGSRALAGFLSSEPQPRVRSMRIEPGGDRWYQPEIHVTIRAWEGSFGAVGALEGLR